MPGAGRVAPFGPVTGRVGADPMRHSALVLCLLLTLSASNGCATAYMHGQTALRQGRYDEAASYFDQVLAEDPGRPDALAGLGIARYKLGAFDEAAATLERVVAQTPTDALARLYLALNYLQKRDAFLAEGQLMALRGLRLDPRLAAQIDRALDVIRSEPLTDPIRTFVSASLETEADLIRELREARVEAQRYGYRSSYPCRSLVRRGRLLYCF